jgi:hypothetical protein
MNIHNESISTITARGLTYGEEYYGNFFRALYTLFQVLTGESWSEAVARPTVFALGANVYLAPIFYFLYIMICGIVLVNVVVAVVLEKMVDNSDDDTGGEEMDDAADTDGDDETAKAAPTGESESKVPARELEQLKTQVGSLEEKMDLILQLLKEKKQSDLVQYSTDA